MFIKSIFLFLPIIAQAEISLRINAYAENKVDFDYKGANIDVITDNERQTFGIGDENLKDAAVDYSGERPDDIFVRSPTPWNDLYKTYNWSEITRTVKPVKIRILNFKNIPVTIYSQEFINNSSLKVVCDTNITRNVSDTVETLWSINNELDVSQDITYAVKINVSYGNSYFFKTKWGVDVMKANTYEIGAKNTTQIELGPHQKVVAKLIAIRRSVDVEVTYKATLDGYLACNYGKKFQGHHFWGYNINDVLDSAKMPKEREFKEIIRIKYFSSSKIIVFDIQTMKRMLEIDAVAL